MNIHRSYPRHGLFARLLRLPRREPAEPPPEPRLDIHPIPPLPPRWIIVGMPTLAWRNAVMAARLRTRNYDEASVAAFSTLYITAPTARLKYANLEYMRPINVKADQSFNFIPPAPPIMPRVTRELTPEEGERMEIIGDVDTSVLAPAPREAKEMIGELELDSTEHMPAYSEALALRHLRT